MEGIICPIMSRSAGSQVHCTENCAWCVDYNPDGRIVTEPKKCLLCTLALRLVEVRAEIQDIHKRIKDIPIQDRK
jgi:hypothetical protein